MEMTKTLLDFSNTEIAFSSKSDEALRKAAWLFGLMNKPWLVNIGSKLGLAAVEWGLPFAHKLVKHTIFEQFCGGTSLEACIPTIDTLKRYKTYTVLDFGAEAKETEADFDFTRDEAIRAVLFAGKHDYVPVVSTKMTGMARFGLLEKINAGQPLNEPEQQEFKRIEERIDSICRTASSNGVSVYIDAEETWIQDTIDNLVNRLMAKYNRERVVVYNTFQLYRNDRLEYLKASVEMARAGGYLQGAKLVRGAYLDKERKRAEEMGYPDPTNPDKATTDQHYNDALRFCIDNSELVSCCNATHNAVSSRLMADVMEQKGVARDHPHFFFCQLYGMSDNLTFNLAHAGYNVGKYVPYGSVRDVIPYLIRRAQENTSVTGDMSREYGLIMQEMARRGLS